MKLTEVPDGIDIVRWKSDDREYLGTAAYRNEAGRSRDR